VVHPYLNQLAAAERRNGFLQQAERHRSRQTRTAPERRLFRALVRRLPGPAYAPFGFFARLGATRGGSPGIFG
jgi:hypothetical protein